MKNIVMGIVAHVDAGKTTLSEAMLYSSGMLDRLGRVDKQDSFLDTYSLERERGITIFSKQAIIDTGGTHITLIDTPGHVDFSCETERTLAVEDYAVLVISAPDGVRPHTRTLWGLLRSRRIPTFIFINKCDISERNREELLCELRVSLSKSCVDFTADGTPSFFEDTAGCDESLMREYFETDTLKVDSIAEAIRRRSIFPCFFGSALKNKGVKELLSGIDKYTKETEYSKTLFGARIYKISKDRNGKRVTFAKITGGSLKPKDTLFIRQDGESFEEKAEELRVFSSDKSKPLKEALPGTVCAIYGPTHTRAGMGLGIEPDDKAMLTPVLDYRLILPDGVSPYETYLKLSEISEEDPSLGIKYDSHSGEIKVSLMGEIQLEVLRRMIEERLGIQVDFDEGAVLYRESVSESTVGSGHFEPLRHYAEVHLRIDPLPEGSGVVADTECDTDSLSLNWQRLIMTHIDERIHKGVGIGAPLTDVKITLIAGKAHLKHTEGGDFRQATYRAIRQGLMKIKPQILEPTFDFTIELPNENLGRAMNDITSMHGTATPSFKDEKTAILSGNCPVATMRSYPSSLRAYTHGTGSITMNVGPYAPAHNSEELIAESGYDAAADERNTPHSVFCSGGRGYTVLWNEADELMHIKPYKEEGDTVDDSVPVRARAIRYNGTAEEDKELMRIFEATYGKPKPRVAPERRENAAPKPARAKGKPKPPGDEYVILDGYNVIFAWDELRRISECDFALARDSLVRLMCSYASFRRVKAIVVFDAYRRKGGEGSIERCGDVTVVYTKEAETADAYIERATYEIAPDNYVRVVTSDLAEQYIILGNGAFRVSAEEFRRECEAVTKDISEVIELARLGLTGKK